MPSIYSILAATTAVGLLLLAGWILLYTFKFTDIGTTRFHAVPVVLFCSSLLLMSLALFYTDKFYRYNPLHVTFILVCISCPFALKVLIRTRKGHNNFMLAVAAMMCIWLCKFFYGIPMFEVLPLNICNLITCMLIIRPFYKNKILDNYILPFAFCGSVANVMAGGDYHTSFFYIETFETNIIHHSFMAISLYMLLTREVELDVKTAAKNYYWILPYFVLMIFLNNYFKFNYFYTSKYENPLLGIYNLFPTFDLNLFNFAFEINLGYYLVLLSGIIIVHLSLTKIFAKIQKEVVYQPAYALAPLAEYNIYK